MEPNNTEKEKSIINHVETAGAPEELKVDQLASHATAAEKHMGALEAFKKNRMAVLWSFLVSLSIVMEGYDTIMIGNFYAYPEFKQKYGVWLNDKSGYQMEAKWQTALGMSGSVGAFIGVFINGWLTERFGHRKALSMALVSLIGLIFITFFAPSVQVLFVGELLCGIPWGIIATLGVMYASEVCPTALRGYLANYVNACWLIGQLIAAGVLQGCLRIENEWAYRIPFALQWLWPPIILGAVFLAPDSPWWLVRQGRFEDAAKSLRKLNNCSETENEEYLAMIIKTNEYEKKLQEGTTYFDCFKGIDLRRTVISCVAFAGQVLSGSTFLYTPTFLFEQAGMATENSYKLSVGGYACGLVGTICSWFLLNRMGRRRIYLIGITTIILALFMIGILQVKATSNPNVAWGQAAFAIIWLFIYSLTIGPLTYTIISETSSTRLRSKTVCLARNTYYICAIISSVLNPYMLNPGQWNWKGYSGFFWCGTAAITSIWAYFCLPECGGRTYEELDRLFEQRVSARKFRNTDVLSISEV
ncbi:alpha-glucosides permease Mph3p [Trichomonascus vanleenenianus]|uniref:alpha-glucosides permease Mph3p n=1 Tax=Trichomonascus vanleenenianus TaxID=2268995 RepID=UPI003EC9C1C2